MLPPYTAPATEEAVTRVIAFFEHLSAADLATLGQLYAPQACFKDPFNEVQGVPAIQAIFAHMFEALEQPRFVVTGRVVQGQQCFLAEYKAAHFLQIVFHRFWINEQLFNHSRNARQREIERDARVRRHNALNRRM